MPYDVTFDVSQFLPALRHLKAGGLKSIDRAVQHTLQYAEDQAKGTTLYRDVTGALRRNTKATFHPGEFGLDVGGDLVADTEYAQFVESGRGPVEARDGGMLRFVSNGTVFYRKRVGPAAPRPFMRNARNMAEHQLRYDLEDYFQGAIDEYNRTGGAGGTP